MRTTLLFVSYVLASTLAAGCGDAPEAPPRAAQADSVPLPARRAVQGEAPLRFRHLTIEDGLSQNAIYALLQDRNGFVWMGTQDGLNRYDGVSFTVYRHNPFDDATLSSSYVETLFEDADGFLWVGTNGSGLNRLDPATGRVVRYANTARLRISALAQDSSGTIWVGTTGQGLFRLPASEAESPEAAFESLSAAARDSTRLLRDRVESMLVDRRGNVWVGTLAGLYRLDEAGRGFVGYALSPDADDGPGTPKVLSLAEGADGTLWVGTEAGLSRLADPSQRRLPFVRNPYRSPGRLGMREIAEGPDGALWVATGDGLVRYDPTTSTFTAQAHDPLRPESLSGNLLTTVMWDRTGVLWVGTNGYGLDLHDAKSTRFQTIRRAPDRLVDGDAFSIRTVFEDARGLLWISAGKLFQYDRRTGVVAPFRSAVRDGYELGSEETSSMVEDRSGRLWFASNGLYVYDPRTGAARVFAYDPARPDGLRAHTVFGVFLDRAGSIWALTANRISRLDDEASGRFTHFTHTPSDAVREIVPSVHEDGRGQFWIGTNDGLVRLDPRTGAVRHYRTDPADPTSLSQDLVRSVEPDPVAPDRVLWIGTSGGGLNRFDIETETFRHVTDRDGLPNNVVYASLPDAEGRLWLSTNRGLARYDPASGDVRTYDASDGLQSNEFNAGAYSRGRDGRLYFGGIYGLDSFDPEAISDNPFVPPVALTGLRIGDRLVAVGDSTGLLDRALWDTEALRLSHRENMVTVTFAALDFSAPEKNRYAYRMEGFDDGWIQAGTNRSATYTNLPPGRYTFRVRGSNNDGVWSEDGASVTVTVAPPPWRSWWAYGLYLLAALGVGTAGTRYRAQQRRLAQRAEADRVRAEALQALDRSKSAFFANVSHEFRTPLTLTLGPLDDVLAGEYGDVPDGISGAVRLARRSAGRVLDLIGQILDLARLEAGSTPLRACRLDLAAFAEAQTATFRPLAVHRHIDLTVRASVAGGVEVWADPEHTATILSNVLSNALKFTPEGGRVAVTVEATDTEARVAVRDTGPGIPPADLPHVFDRFSQVAQAPGSDRPLGTGIGLSLAHDLARLHGGAITAQSVLGSGSVFTLSLPLGRDHLDAHQVHDGEWDGTTASAVAPYDLIAGTHASDGGASDGGVDDGGVDDGGVDDGGVDDGGVDDDVTTVLVADDNADIRAFVRRHLEGAGYRVAEAADGEEALSMATARVPDLVVTDVMMPRRDGLGLCRALRSSPDTDFVPILMLTAKAAPEDRLDGLAEHCDDYLTKPFDVRELVARVGNLIALRRRLRDRFAVADSAPGDGALGEAPLPSDDDAFAASVRTAIAARLGDEALSVATLAQALGQSRSQLLRRTTATLHASPSDLIRTARLDRAAGLLHAQAGTVSEVAYAVGFKSVAHFSNAFLAHTGRRPSVYAEEAG